MTSRRMVLGLALLGMICLPAPSLARQRLSGVAVGDRVKLRAGDERARGVVEAIEIGAVEVRDEGTEEIRAFNLTELDRLQVHRGTKRATKRGLVIGVLGGVLIGAVHGSTYSICNHCSGDAAGVEMILLGLLGAPVGALVGSRASVDVWETVALPEPSADGSGFGPGFRIGISIPVRWN